MVDYKEMLSSIPEGKKFEIVRNNWMSHDARWQMLVVKNYGWDVGNKLNQEAVKKMGRIMMYRMMNALGISNVENPYELINLMLSVVTLNYPTHQEGEFQMLVESRSSIKIQGHYCSTHENIKKVNAEGKYECGCFPLREGFFNALQLEVKQDCSKSLMKGDEQCVILLKVKNWEEQFNTANQKSNIKSEIKC